MTYIVDAAHLDPDGRPVRLRWRAVPREDATALGEPEVVAIEDALRLSAGEPVLIRVAGHPDAQLMRERVGEEDTFVDSPIAQEGSRMKDLPTIVD